MFVIRVSKWHDTVLSREEVILTGKAELFLSPSHNVTNPQCLGLMAYFPSKVISDLLIFYEVSGLLHLK